MKNKTTRFLVISILCVAVLCVFVFSFMTLRMSRRGSDAISDLGKFYMSGMSEQAATHFGTAIELRLAQVSALADAVPPSSSDDYQKLSVKLNNNARLRGFDHLAFCGKDGTLEMLYGYQMQVDDPESFRLSLAGGKEKMAHGKDSTVE